LIFSIFFGVGYTVVVPTVSQVVKDSAAAAAGFAAGDEILSINGKPITKWADDAQRIRDSHGTALTFVVKRDGKEISLVATPRYNAVEKRYVLGVVNSLGTQRDGIVKSTTSGAQATWYLTKESAKSLLSIPTKLPQLVRETFMGEKRDPNGLVGVVGAARASGEVVGSSNLNATETLATFLLMVASLNIFVALFNLLPILPLDGGHMAVAIADEVRAFYARLRGRARPAPIDVNVLTPVTMVVFVLLVAMTVLLLIADIFNPVSLNL
jgi:RIP metalloprotease RseP